VEASAGPPGFQAISQEGTSVKRLNLVFVFFACGFVAPAFATDVSASIGVSQPGFYGQINIGQFPRPAVIYAEPVWVARPPKVVYVQPIYLHVPPGHEKHWSKHCARYGACGRPVYFVREDWYQTQYVPYYQRHDHDDHDGWHDRDGEGQHGKGHEGHESHDD
jgi:hypothetical protein